MLFLRAEQLLGWGNAFSQRSRFQPSEVRRLSRGVLHAFQSPFGLPLTSLRRYPTADVTGSMSLSVQAVLLAFLPAV